MKKISQLSVLITFIATAWTFHAKIAMMIFWIQGLGWLAPILFILLFSFSTLLFLPAVPFVLAGGAIFGPVWGTVFNIMSATLGAIGAFLISRHLGTDWLSPKKSAALERLSHRINHHGWKSVAVMRLTPTPFSLVNYGFGLTQINLRLYALTTFLFLIPYKIIATYFGYFSMISSS
ncbi:MAG: VTT domain-containing protein [Legionellaceae bacterium]|nr:VTT domain-containing protein [Legionellaceae bacterium]